MEGSGQIKSFEDLVAWKEGHSLVLEVYRVTTRYPTGERFELISQTRRAVASITSNIAEGFGRFHYNDKIRFYYQARGSATELLNHLILAKDLRYIDLEALNSFREKLLSVNRLIDGLIRSIESQK